MSELMEFDADAAGEFPKQAAIDQAKHEDSDGYFGFLTGAEWQFERDRIQIAMRNLQLQAASEQNKQLEARLQESERLGATYARENESLQIKLAQAEARIKELESLLEWTENMRLRDHKERNK